MVEAVPVLPCCLVSGAAAVIDGGLLVILSVVVALQGAAPVAVTVPPVFEIPVTVRPAGTVVAVTVSVPAASSASLTIAMVDTVPALPCCLAIGAAAVMFGGVLASLDGEP